MRNRNGFTLVELSIVLVIIGLIAAGIVVGKSMFTAAESRAILTEINIYTTAFKEFTDKYQAIPGDMNNAESIWFADDSCPNTAANSAPKTPTCNGNGGGTIGDWTNGATSGGSEYEWFRAWQQLANSELIEGRYTGVMGGASTEALPSLNVPLSKTGKGGWTLMHMSSNGAGDDFFNSRVASHVLIYGAATYGSITDSPALVAEDMKAIDTKIDDGMPFTGSVRVKKNAIACTVSDTPTSAYKLDTTDATSTAPSCQFLYLLGV